MRWLFGLSVWLLYCVGPGRVEAQDAGLSIAERARRLAAEIPSSALEPVSEAHASQRAELLRALRLQDDEALHIRSTATATTTFVVTYRTNPGGSSLNAMDARVHLLKKARLIASGRLRFPSEICADEDPMPGSVDRDFSVDPEQVRLAQHSAAWLVRLRCATSAPSTYGEETHAFLVELQGTALNQVLTFAERSSSLDRVSSVETEEQTRIALAPSRHAGYRDVKLHLTTTRKPADAHGEPGKQQSTEVTYLRCGSTYVFASSCHNP